MELGPTVLAVVDDDRPVTLRVPISNGTLATPRCRAPTRAPSRRTGRSTGTLELEQGAPGAPPVARLDGQPLAPNAARRRRRPVAGPAPRCPGTPPAGNGVPPSAPAARGGGDGPPSEARPRARLRGRRLYARGSDLPGQRGR